MMASDVKYDVFLSFRGEDTRYKFTSHLLAALRRETIETFIDDELIRGEEIAPSILRAIEKSLISVIIFSKRYASSRWCLEELVKVLECKEKYGQVVIPVFYKVDPSDVRNQTGVLGDSLNQLRERYADKEQIWRDNEQRWRDALTEAGKLSGFDSKVIRSESVVVEKIVKDILEKLNYISSSDNKGLVGVQSCIKKIKSLLRIGFKDVRIIGIWGMGGIGKTTIAKAVFDEIYSEFHESFFAENVGKELERNGLTLLQDKLRSRNSNKRFTLTKRRLDRSKVLMVLDDVSSFEQKELLIGNLRCLASESRIIVTTRDRQVLKNCGVDDSNIFKVEGLFHREALKLFSLHAFQQNHPTSCYHKLANMAIKYAKGIPLALKVLGSYLFGRTDQFWYNAINKLQRVPHKDIQEVLKVSYDGLDNEEKNMILDIACFFNLENVDLVTKFLDASKFSAEVGISILIDRCLITISNNKITMHDLLQKMGWEIVREASSRDNGKLSRLWYHEDIYNILKGNQGTKAIEGICLDMSEVREINLSPHVFTEMQSLRLLKVYNTYCKEKNINKVHISNGLESIFTELRYLCWHGCPLQSLQSNFRPENLVALDMPRSNVKEFWDGVQNLCNLIHINLSHSKHLLKSPDLSCAPNLERLILEGCSSLNEIFLSTSQSFDKLVILNLRDCKSLHSLPTSFHSKSLRRVILSCCSNFKTLPEISCNIQELFLDETAIEELPPSIKNLSRVVILNLKNCSKLKSLPISICKMKSLQHLNLLGCSRLDGLIENLVYLEAWKVCKIQRVVEREVMSSTVYLRCLMELNLTNCCIMKLPNSLGQLSSLKRLLLGKNKFDTIPTNIIRLSKLSYLDLGYCERLQLLPRLPCQLQYIDAHNCTSLEASEGLSILYQNILRNARVNFINCLKLDQNGLREVLKHALQEIQSSDGYKEFYPRPNACICFPGTEIPGWFTKQSTGSSIMLEVPSNWLNFRFAMGAVVEFDNYHDEGKGFVVGCYCKLRSRGGTVMPYHGTLRGWFYGIGPQHVDSDHVFLGCDFHICPPGYHDKMSIQFYVEDLNAKRLDCCQVKKCGIHLLDEVIDEAPLLDEEINEEPRSKRLKISTCFEGESNSRNSVYTRKRKRKWSQTPGD